MPPDDFFADGSFGQTSRFTMDVEDFREIALSFRGAEEGSHMGKPDFRVGGRIFATLASQESGFGNLMLTPELQKTLVQQDPEVFLPIAGGWGRNGATHIRLAKASESQLTEALSMSWKLRADKNAKPKTRRKSAKKKPKQ